MSAQLNVQHQVRQNLLRRLGQNESQTNFHSVSAISRGADGFPIDSMLNELPTLRLDEPAYDALSDRLPREYDYLLYHFENVDRSLFLGAPDVFKACFRVNVKTPDAATKFVQDFNLSSCATLKISRGKVAVKGVKSLYHKKFHCIHSLMVKQKQGKSEVEKELNRPVVDGDNRRRCSDCPAKMTLYVQNWENQRGPKATHPSIVKVYFTHNHGLDTAHALSFRGVGPEAKAAYFALFERRHGPGPARREFARQLRETSMYDVRDHADRSKNPNRQDVHRLHKEWLQARFGQRNGSGVFESLGVAINEYKESGRGNATFQPFKVMTNEAGIAVKQPFVLAMVSKMMERTHGLPHAGEVVGMDGSAGLDDLNIVAYVLSTPTPVGGLALGVIFASDEEQETFERGLELLDSILPAGRFGGRGHLGPSVFMTDDCAGPRNALREMFPSAELFLCAFHLLQAFWRWLWDSDHGIGKGDRNPIMSMYKTLVYAASEDDLLAAWNVVQKGDFVVRYPGLKKHLDALWSRRREWSYAYRNDSPLRGTHTTAIMEAGFRIAKDYVFERVKAFNVVEMFHLFSRNLEDFYVDRLADIANNRNDRFLSARFNLRTFDLSGYNLAESTSENIGNVFVVASKTQADVTYTVDLDIGTCSNCSISRGTCPHLAYAAKMSGYAGVSLAPTMDPITRHKFAQIAYGDRAPGLEFYADIRQAHHEGVRQLRLPEYSGRQNVLPEEGMMEGIEVTEDFSSTTILREEVHEEDTEQDDQMDELLALLDRIRVSVAQLSTNPDKQAQTLKAAVKVLRKTAIACEAADITKLVDLANGVGKGRRTHSGRAGARMPVQVTATARRRGGSSGRRAQIAGRPAGGVDSISQEIPPRKKRGVKRRHDLTLAVQAGRRNGGQ